MVGLLNIAGTALLLIAMLIMSIMHYNHVKVIHKKETEIRVYTPIFEDMIFTDLEYQDKRKREEVLNSNIFNETIALSRNHNPQALELEVHHSLQAALAFKRLGKVEKALKLFEHAASISPNNPDVLNHYGEFIEEMDNDIITADEYYFKALANCPDHKAALMNHQRTSHLVEKLDLELFNSIDKDCDTLKELQASNPFFDAVKKHTYYLHIYHTVGIEGNTFTVEELRHVLETGQVIHGKALVEHNEIVGLQMAMAYVKILTRFPQITVNEILAIHRRVLLHADPMHSGVFRTEQVFVGSHIPPSPEDIPELMANYVEWLNSEEALSMHPVRYAALAHYKLVDIHPFIDGNGRTSRLIMNLILLRAGYPPIIVMKNHRDQYYDVLRLANLGDVRPFVRFIARCTKNTMRLYISSTDHFSRGIIEVEHKTKL